MLSLHFRHQCANSIEFLGQQGGQGGPLYRSRVTNFPAVIYTHVQETNIHSAESGFCEPVKLKGCSLAAQGLYVTWENEVTNENIHCDK